jgi:hypothetical protein
MSLTLSSVIYPAECLEETVTAYAGVCSVCVFLETDKGYSIEILPAAKEIDQEQLTNEFMNYLLNVSIERFLRLMESE